MSGVLQTHRRKLLAVGGLAGAFLAAPYLGIEVPNIFRTPGVKNIEKRYSSGGGSPNHLPAIASKRGDPDSVVGNTEKTKGMGSQHWEEHIGGQKPEGSTFDKTWNKAHYGAEKGK